MLAITICAPTSGGHLNPCITIAFAVFKGFPWRKVPQYIFSQIFGAFVGACLVYAQYAPELSKITKAMQEAGQEAAIFTPSGPAGAIALLPAPGSQIGIIFVNEFISTAIVGITVFSVLDPSNIFITPASSPIVISVVFFVIIICFGPNGVALNTARDLGGRLAAACFWGRGVFPAKYSALAVLTNIAGTLFGALFQVLFLSDTVRPPTSGALSVHRAMTAEKEGHMARIMTARENGIEPAFSRLGRIITPKTEAKGETQHIEKSMA
jgi:glycerol uptake facilitator-like aquaporin